MSKSLLEQLPEIVRAGKRQAERIMEGLEARSRVGLQTRELVTPAKDTNWQEFQSLKPHAKAQATLAGDLALLNDTAGQTQLIASRAQWFNRLIYGDNLLCMAALLAGDAESPSLRGKIDLIYIDPPFDSRADYRTKITLPGGDVEQKPTVIEQFAYSDTWANGTASYLAMIVPRLCLMRELLSDRGSIYVHIDWHVSHYVKLALDEMFGKEQLVNEIVWKRQTAKGDITQGASHMGRIGAMMTGIRSCSGAIASFAARVMMVNDSIVSLGGASSRSVSALSRDGGLIHFSHKPAKQNGSPLFSITRNGCRLPSRSCHS